VAHGSEPRPEAEKVGTGSLWRARLRSFRSFFGEAITLGAPIGLVVAVVSLALLTAMSRTAFRDRSFGWLERLELLSGELFLACVLGVVVGAVMLGWASVVSRMPSRQKALGAFALATAWFLTFAYAASWGLFWAFGSFLDSSSLSFALSSSKLLVKHVLETNPVLLVLLPGSALALVFLARRGLRALSLRKAPLPGSIVALLALGSLSLVASAFGEFGPAQSHVIVRDPALGLRLSLGRAYRTARTHRGGPLSHLLLIRSPNSQAGAPITTDDLAGRHLRIVRRPQIALDAWAASLDRSALKHWNVIVLLFDSAQPSVLKAFGGTRDVMPVVDRLAEGSLRFSMYAQASHSNYADPAVLSSHYPLRDPEHHLYPRSPPYPRVLIYDVLKKLGWRTGLVSSQNEHWGNMHSYLDTGGLDHFFHAESLKSAALPEGDPGFADWAKSWGYSGKIDDRDSIDEAIRFIGNSPGKQPFFLYVNLQNSHFPYRTPEGYERPFQPDTIDFVPYAFGNYPQDKIEVVKNRWRNSLRYVDGQIGRLVSHLERTGQLDSTLFVLGADNGEAFYEHDIVCHAGSLFDESIRVPVILHGPGVEPGTYRGLSQAIDIVPTVLGRLGLPPHPSFQGLDLIGGKVDSSRSVYVVAQTPKADQLAMVRDGWKIIYDYWYEAYLLFDLERDPGETRDLALEESGRLRVMAEELRTWERVQLEYYRTAELMRTTYPPLVAPAVAVRR